MTYDIAILGGGTAGWMSAAVLSRFLGPNYRIQLIESDAIGTVGVGEASIPQLRLINQAIGIDETDFMRATQATFKLAIEFAGWTHEGERYFHAFGDIGRDMGLVPFHHYWLRGRALGFDHPLWAYSASAGAAGAGRFERAAPVPNSPANISHAYHFDAGLYAGLLRRHAEQRGVVRHEGIVQAVDQDPETGNVRALRMDGERTITADLFLDCSGFAGLLLRKTLGVRFEDWSRWLPCDRAWAVPCGNAPDLTPFTRATARPAGWQWRIPLQHRIGNGHVFSSAFMAEDEARDILMANLDGEPLAEPRLLKFTAGRMTSVWAKNVVALGLASGFLEPLESTSIHLVQSALERLLKFLPNGAVNAADVREYNRQAEVEIERVRDFLILHYHVNQRLEPFWQSRRDMAIPDTLAEKIALFQANGRIHRLPTDLFAEPGWLQVMLGQGLVPDGYNPLADQASPEELTEFLRLLRETVARRVEALPPHKAYIERTFGMPA